MKLINVFSVQEFITKKLPNYFYNKYDYHFTLLYLYLKIYTVYGNQILLRFCLKFLSESLEGGGDKRVELVYYLISIITNTSAL
jgi:hypothetical protein